MKELKMKECKRSTNVTEIKEFEDFIEAKLPKDYIEHLLKYNGGRSEEDCYPFIELPALDDTIGDIHYFYALYEGDLSNLKKKYDVFKGRVPNEMISIASDACGNQICLGIREPYYGKVYIWDHELEAADGEPIRYDNIYLIANSFTDFINKLYKE